MNAWICPMCLRWTDAEALETTRHIINELETMVISKCKCAECGYKGTLAVKVNEWGRLLEGSSVGENQSAETHVLVGTVQTNARNVE